MFLLRRQAYKAKAKLDTRRPVAAYSPLKGPVAQLGERVVRNDEVVGSIPIRSTSKHQARTYSQSVSNFCLGHKIASIYEII